MIKTSVTSEMYLEFSNDDTAIEPQTSKAILHLHLKKKYYDAIASGEKTVEFRRTTDYWRKRLIGRHYDEIWLYCGYPKRGDTSRIIKRRWSLVAKETILHEEFGDEPAEVFCISVLQPIAEPYR